jgi:hypothetical protein
MVAQTMVRQLISVVNTSIWSVRWRTLLCETLDRVGGADRAVHGLGKVVKGECLLFLLGQTAHRLWIEFAVLGFEGGQLSR